MDSNKQRSPRQVMQLIFGNNMWINVIIVGMYLFAGVGMMAEFVLIRKFIYQGYTFSKDFDLFIIMLLLGVFFLIFTVIISVLTVIRGIHMTDLKFKFSEFEREDQEEIIECVERYKGPGVAYNNHFIYGNMGRVFNYHFPGNIIGFEYFPFTDIKKIDTLKSPRQEKKSQDIGKAVTSTIIGASVAYKRTSPESGMRFDSRGLDRIDNQKGRADNYICIELNNGEKYRVEGNCENLKELEPLIKAVNQWCVVGGLRD